MKNCLNCGEALIGRSDKKFCNDGCRSSFNHLRDQSASQRMREINRQLRRNYRILREVSQDSHVVVSRSFLSSKGFDFNYMTQYRGGGGPKKYFLYDLGYTPLWNGDLKLIALESTPAKS